MNKVLKHKYKAGREMKVTRLLLSKLASSHIPLPEKRLYHLKLTKQNQ